MHVEHLLGDASLGLRLLWAEDALLRREISGVTVTDLEDPARFVRPGEVVLSGLVWWSPDGGYGKAERFVSALRDAGAAALLAGEETHGSVPDDLIQACVRHGVPVAGVPAHIMFRSITDTVYLRQWGGLSRHHALPENARVRLSRLLAREAGPDAVLAEAFAHLGGSTAYVFTASGRTVAATEGAPRVPAREAVALVADGAGLTASVDASGVSPYERWVLYVPDPDCAPPRMLHEVAAVLAHCQEAAARRPSAGLRATDELGALLAAPDAREDGTVEAVLRRCGLPETGPYQVLVADAATRQPDLDEGLLAEGALSELAGHVVGGGGVGGVGAAGGAGGVGGVGAAGGAGRARAAGGAGGVSGAWAAGGAGEGGAGAVGGAGAATHAKAAAGAAGARAEGGVVGAGRAEAGVLMARRAAGDLAAAGRADGGVVAGRADGGVVAAGRAHGVVVAGGERGAGGAVAVGRLPDGSAFAVLSGVPGGWAEEVWPLVADCAPGVLLHGGTGAPAAGPGELAGALAQARYALTSARTTVPDASRLTDAGSLTTLDALLTGVPAEVRTAYARTVLGPLLETGRPSIAALLGTLETFLACDGSWARTAQALHLHVNTVHYRVERIERLTGRDLSRLRDRLDLWAALLCR
ncbi:helix-turn-helix domain-containing protein [Streptomyces camelliae]|uniref:Helix-turn-helix domain-containing protein n=1 Tax=Streptomyces camelliae TaxID=3004093 RepID=A0ABY7PBR5_9ACTN|nr:PucR family transcriptional regulator [Streptomyces sp. HUAS 2-6]WBO67650.1 helix-turn-helix domain-containing protein [Streptomyces sp. HUAS 2-6]